MANLAQLQRIIQYQFNRQELLQQALTHRSCGSFNNERLEFLGDSLLNNIVTRYIYNNHISLNEGELSCLRAYVVNNDTLASVAETLELATHIDVGPSLQNGAFRSVSVLSDCFEAIIGAIFEDGGWLPTELFVTTFLQTHLNDLSVTAQRDAKSVLQEWLQNRGYHLPEYAIVNATGPSHQRHYEICCILKDYEKITNFPIQGTLGSGNSRKVAEQMAAKLALQIIQTN